MKGQLLKGVTEVYWNERLEESKKLTWVISTLLLTACLHFIMDPSPSKTINIAVGTVGSLYTVSVLYFHRSFSKLPKKWQKFFYILCWSAPLTVVLMLFLIWAILVIFTVASSVGSADDSMFTALFGKEYGKIIGFFILLILASVVFIKKAFYEFKVQLLYGQLLQWLKECFEPKNGDQGGAIFVIFELSILVITIAVEHLIYSVVNVLFFL